MRRTVTLFVILLFVFLQVPAQSGTGFAYEDITSGLSSVPVERPDSGYRWIDRIEYIPDYMVEFHKTYGEMVREVLDGGQNCLSNPLLGEKAKMSNGVESYSLKVTTFYDTVSFTFRAGSTERQIKAVANNVVTDYVINQSYDVSEANMFVDYLIMSLHYDYPEAFWINTSFPLFFDPSGSKIIYADQKTGNGLIAIEIKMLLQLADDSSDNRFGEFLEEAVIGMQDFRYESVTAFNDSIDSILARCPSTDRCAQIVYFNDWLTKHNGYCTDNPVTATPTIRSSYSAISGRSGDNGPVCEGYARAFKTLCDRVGIPCIVVTGYARQNNISSTELHMWNEVQMENDYWYAVDVTWNDPVPFETDLRKKAVSGYENVTWLLKGKRDNIGQNFTFGDSHPNSLTWQTENSIYWSYSIKSLIVNTGYDIDWEKVWADIENARNDDNSVYDIPYDVRPEYLRAYSIDGRYLGTFSSVDGMCRILKDAGTVIVNGKKMYIK